MLSERIRIPIGWKITLVVTAVLFLLAVSSILFIRERFSRNLESEYQSKAVAIAQALASSSEEKLVAGNVESVQSFVDGFRGIAGLSYVFIQDPGGRILVHTFKVRVPPGIGERNPVKGDEKYRSARFDDASVGPVLEVAVPILFGTAGTVHVGMNEGLIHAELTAVTWNLILQFLLATVVGIVLLHLATRFLLSPLNAVLASLRRVGEGDLTFEARVATNDEFADLAREVNGARARLSEMISRVRQAYDSISSVNARIGKVYSEVLAGSHRQAALAAEATASVEGSRKLAGDVTASTHVLEKTTTTSVSAVMELGASIEEVSGQAQTLYRSVGETNRALKELSDSVAEISRNLSTLSKASDETASAMSEMRASVEEVRLHAESTAGEAASMTEVADQGVKASREAMEGMSAIRESSTVVTGLISTLTRRIEEIDEILRFITDITGKTNLLALNAAIIAAQAGAQGKGFGVVADEINELAQSTNAQTKKIGAVIDGIRQEVKRTDKAIHDSNQRVEEGGRLTRQTAEALEKIRQNTNLVSERVREIARTTSEQAQTGRRVMETTENLAGSVENIREAGARQSDSGQKILELARNVETVADKLKNSTVEETETSRLINADLVRMTQTVGEIARASEEQGAGSQKVFTLTRDLGEIIEMNQKSVVGLQEVISVLEERMTSLRRELEGFTIEERASGGDA